MKKIITVIFTLLTVTSIGITVFARDIGNYSSTYNIGQSILYTNARHRSDGSMMAVNNNSSMGYSNGSFTTNVYCETVFPGTATNTLTLTKGKIVYPTYYAQYGYLGNPDPNQLPYEYWHYRLFMCNQSSYGSTATGSWCPTA